jgi:PST family polysaccharide transporter
MAFRGGVTYCADAAAHAMSTESLTGASARGGVYVLIRRVAANAIRLGAVAVLARRLDRGEFGVVALAQLAVSLLTVFGTGGVITYIVCDREADWQARTSPAFWLNLALTTASCAVALALLPLVQYVYGEPLLGQVLLVILATYFVTQLRMVPEALLQRRLAFRVLAVRDTARDFSTAAVAVAMALGGFGVWSLVVPNLVVAPLDVAFTAWQARFWPSRSLGRGSWSRIFRFTRSVIAEQLLSFIGNETDTAIVGKVMGTAVVGVYNLAYQLANLIGKNVSAVLTMVSTPALAAAFERRTGIGSPYRKMMRVLSLISTPLLLGMFVLADELIGLVYGPKWSDAVPLLRIFIVSTLVRSVTSPSGAVFNVVGRPELSMKIALGFVALYVPALVLFSRWGLVPFALCVAAARFIVGLVSLYISLDLIAESKARVTDELIRPLIAGIAMAIAVWGVDRALIGAGVPAVVRIAAGAVVGAVVYLGAARLLAQRAFGEAMALIKDLARRRARVADKAAA